MNVAADVNSRHSIHCPDFEVGTVVVVGTDAEIVVFANESLNVIDSVYALLGIGSIFFNFISDRCDCGFCVIFVRMDVKTKNSDIFWQKIRFLALSHDGKYSY